MRNFEKNHLKLKVSGTSIGPRPKKAGQFKAESIAAAKNIFKSNEGQPPTLLLNSSYESASTFFAFLKAGGKFEVSYLKFAALAAAPEFAWIEQLAAKHHIKCTPVIFDFSNKEHLISLEQLQKQTSCLDMETLFNLWCTCNIDAATVLPGRFCLPQFDTSLEIKSWDLPVISEHGLFDFFKTFGGVPFFLAYSASLCYSQIDSAVADTLIHLAKEKKTVTDQLAQSRCFYQQSGFLAVRTPPPRSTGHLYRLAIAQFPVDASEAVARIEFQINVLNKNFPMVRKTTIGERVRKGSTRLVPTLHKLGRDVTAQGAIIPVETQNSMTSSMTSSMNVYAAFPTLITTHRFQGNINQTLQDVKKIEFFKNVDNEISSTDLHVRPEFSALLSFFNASMAAHLGKMNLIFSSIEIIQLWANKSGNGNCHHYHYHPNCMFSGIFYLTEGGGGTTVFDNNPLRQSLEVAHHQFNEWNSKSFQISPQQGLLVIFPSLLNHRTKQHSVVSSVRYTLAFNILVRGDIGNLADGTFLRL